MIRRLRRKTEQGLTSVAPLKGALRLSEEINAWWLWLVAIGGIFLFVLAILLNILWKVTNILPSASLSLGVSAILFAVFFLLERKIVRRTSMISVSPLEELGVQIRQNTNTLVAHFNGPVAAVNNFVCGILDYTDYRRAWRLADANWRLCRAQAWLWSNRGHPTVTSFGRDAAARALSEIESTHELWTSFAESELQQFTEIWSDPDLRTYGAASATRRVHDGEIVLLIDLSEYPEGAIAHTPTQVFGVPFLVHRIDDTWYIANLVGEKLPEPGWPPDWKEGWTYWN